MEIEEKVKSLVVDKLKVDAEQVRLDSKFNDLGADSLETMDLIMAFEDAFQITIEDQDMAKITTVGEAIDFIKQKKATA
ncbi:MAG: acyl carrier protein [Candidatus Fischerbacteria bacterium RBG_13_37_8]|uniref:Acyl carrier protein n=1 Tax=Candidatus Fischerbacteria bacterium RBG_13_37_8 TaxID=1817863 RepID=A0A1F5VFP6_9BACT|nr:MAG: acyl carrier protein [Candidatus Fischerbacteria bacterium RBG_13_37_8]